MLPALSTAADGLAAQSQRVEAVAQVVTALGASAPAGTTQVVPQVSPQASPQASPATPVRVADLPVGHPIVSVVTLAEAQNAYRMNAPEEAPKSGMLVPLGYVFDEK